MPSIPIFIEEVSHKAAQSKFDERGRAPLPDLFFPTIDNRWSKSGKLARTSQEEGLAPARRIFDPSTVFPNGAEAGVPQSLIEGRNISFEKLRAARFQC